MTRQWSPAAAAALGAAALVLAALALAGPVPRSLDAVATATGEARRAVHHRTGQSDLRPDVVVVMADDMRVDDLLFAPRIRSLVARHGLTFENSFAPYPLCCPDRASFLTGQYAHNHHVYWSDPPFGYATFDDSRTLATSLHAAGYHTAYVGRYLNGYGPARSVVSGRASYRYVPRGWDDWRAAFENPHRDGIHGGTFDYFDTPFDVNGQVDDRHRGSYSTDVIGRFSLDAARRGERSGRPFFLFVNYVAPHTGGPREPDDPVGIRDDHGYPHVFDTPARPRWVRGRFDSVIDRGAGIPRGGGPSERDITDKPRAFWRPEPDAAERLGLRTLTRQRAEAVFVMDQQVGRLVRQLKRSGAWQRTVLVFTSDNGYYLGEHRKLYGKVFAHEPSLRVPLLVTGPGMRSGEVRDDPVSVVDLSATVLELAGASPPHTPDGASRLVTMLQGDQGWSVPVLDEAAYTRGLHRHTPGFGGPRTSIGVRTARYSLIRSRTGEDELYDLLRDPLENRSVARSPHYHHVRHELLRVWRRLRNCAGASCQVLLPPDLVATPEQERQFTARYWHAVIGAYGFRGSGRLHP